MIIGIKQKFSVVGRSYQISTDGVWTHRARKRFFSLFSTIKLYRNKELKITMVKEFGYNNENYHILVSGGPELHFKKPSDKEDVYSCKVNDDLFMVYADRGSWVQVIKNDNLIAGWEKNDIRFSNHDYQIRSEGDIEAEILITFCLIGDDLQNIRTNASL